SPPACSWPMRWPWWCRAPKPATDNPGGRHMTEVVVERNLLIPMSDGVQLAADLFHPAGAGKWPALLNYLPYHKDGRGGRLAVEGFNRHMAARGYACLTLDIRGMG